MSRSGAERPALVVTEGWVRGRRWVFEVYPEEGRFAAGLRWANWPAGYCVGGFAVPKPLRFALTHARLQGDRGEDEAVFLFGVAEKAVARLHVSLDDGTVVDMTPLGTELNALVNFFMHPEPLDGATEGEAVALSDGGEILEQARVLDAIATAKARESRLQPVGEGRVGDERWQLMAFCNGHVLELQLSSPTGSSGSSGPVLSEEQQVEVAMSGWGAQRWRSIVGQVRKAATSVSIQLRSGQQVEAELMSVPECPVSVFVAWLPDDQEVTAVAVAAPDGTHVEPFGRWEKEGEDPPSWGHP